MVVSSVCQAAGIYVRISRDQGGQALGVTRQEKLCRELAERKGWPVAKVYSDNDLSAFSGSPRPAYQEMLADLEAGAIDAVLVVDQDRLTRHPSELETFIGVADRLGVALANVSGDIDLSTSDGRFRARILGAVARQESEKKSERLKRQRDQHARLGLAHGGIRRYGYRPTRTAEGAAVLEVDKAEAALVSEAATRFLAGESLRSIAIDWNNRSIPTVTGAMWKVTTFRTLLSGPHLAGLRVHRGEIVGPAQWPAILERDTWELIRATLGDPRRARKGRPPVHLLTGVVTCGRCGGPMYSSRRTSGTRRYVCQPPPGEGCGRVAIVAEQLEEHITEAVLEALDSPAMAEALAGQTPDRIALTRRIEDDEQRLEQLARDHYSEGIIGKREYLAAKESIEQRLDETRRQLAATAPTGTVDRTRLHEEWDTATLEARRSTIGLVVESVRIGPGLSGRHLYDPERVSITWRA